MATASTGIEELWDAVEEHQRGLADGSDLAERRKAQLRSELLALASARPARRLGEVLDSSPDLAGLVDALAERRIDPCGRAAAARARMTICAVVYDFHRALALPPGGTIWRRALLEALAEQGAITPTVRRSAGC